MTPLLVLLAILVIVLLWGLPFFWDYRDQNRSEEDEQHESFRAERDYNHWED